MTERLDRCKVFCDGALRDAMYALEMGSCGIALVVSKDDTLLGTITDGDIRRALLAGKSPASPLTPHMQRRFTTVGPREERAAVIELMQARTIEQIPIVDEAGKLIGMHLLRELVGIRRRPNWAVIMAGGKGVRLHPITQFLPKPMIPVAGRPILERLVLHLVGFGIRRIYLATHYLGHMVEEHFGDGERFGCQISYLREAKPLGTAGSLSLLTEEPTEPVLVMNGDLVTQADIGAMLDSHESSGRAVTVAVRQYAHEVPFGCVEMEGDQILQIIEKPTLVRYVNAGIYVLGPQVVARVRPGEELPMTNLLDEAIKRGERVGAFELVGDWIDVGQPNQLKFAREGGAPGNVDGTDREWPRTWNEPPEKRLSRAA